MFLFWVLVSPLAFAHTVQSWWVDHHVLTHLSEWCLKCLLGSTFDPNKRLLDEVSPPSIFHFFSAPPHFLTTTCNLRICSLYSPESPARRFFSSIPDQSWWRPGIKICSASLLLSTQGVTLERIPWGSPADPPGVRAKAKGILWGSSGDSKGISIVWHHRQRQERGFGRSRWRGNVWLRRDEANEAWKNQNLS